MEDIEKWKKEYKECGFKSNKEFLWIYVLGGCGCGSPEKIENKLWEVFENFALSLDDWDKRDSDVYEQLDKEILAHWLDSKGLIEHGSSIGGSWLSETGKELYKMFKESKKEFIKSR